MATVDTRVDGEETAILQRFSQSDAHWHDACNDVFIGVIALCSSWDITLKSRNTTRDLVHDFDRPEKANCNELFHNDLSATLGSIMMPLTIIRYNTGQD